MSDNGDIQNVQGRGACRTGLKTTALEYHKTFTFIHLADAFIQSDLHCIQVTVFYILSALAFPGNRTHDLGVASAMLYHLSYRKAICLNIKICTHGND